MKKEDVKVGSIYEGRPRRGLRILRDVVSIDTHPGFATEVRFIEDYIDPIGLHKSSPERRMTLKSFLSWASRGPGKVNSDD